MKELFLGKEVDTKFGKGVIVKIESQYNGLYIDWSTVNVTVWFGTEKANPFVTFTFIPSELC